METHRKNTFYTYRALSSYSYHSNPRINVASRPQQSQRTCKDNRL